MTDDAHAQHPESFIWKYVFSTDHKVIAKQYMFTGMAMALLGGFLAYVIRMNLNAPGESVPGYGALNFMQYNAVVFIQPLAQVTQLPLVYSKFFLFPETHCATSSREPTC